MKDKKTITDYIQDKLGFFNLWLFFVVFEMLIYYFYDIELSLLFAILMIPIFIHDVLLKIFKEKK